MELLIVLGRRLEMPFPLSNVAFQLKGHESDTLLRLFPKQNPPQAVANAIRPTTCLRACKNFRAYSGKAIIVRKRVIEDIFEVCENNGESLSTALSFMSVYGYKGAKMIVMLL